MKTRRKLSRRLTPLKVVLYTLMIVFLMRWNMGMVNPNVTIPLPRLPNPNAYDRFLQARKLIDPQPSDNSTTSDATDADKLSLGEKRALLAKNAPVLRLIREGLSLPYVHPPARSFRDPVPDKGEYQLARLLRVESDVRAAQGDWNGAMSSGLDAIQMGEMIPHGSPIIGQLVGIRMQTTGREGVWKAILHLNGMQARMAVRRLESILAQHVGFAETIQEEKWFLQAAWMQMFRGSLYKISRAMETNPEPESPIETEAKAIGTQFIYLAWSKRKIMEGLTRYMDGLIANARHPYAAHPALPPLPSDPWNRIVLPVYGQVRFREVEGSETQNALLLTMLALRVYQAEHGAYPDNLDALVSNRMLARVPADPFALNGPLRYRRKASGYVLYSIGPDCKNDSGKPIDGGKPIKFTTPKGTKPQPYRRYAVLATSQGDIVAGINTR